MFLFKELITRETCQRHPEFIYVFGDNLQGYGTDGQAIIRFEPNSFGIPTKREPTRSPAAYFTDSNSEITSVKSDLAKLDKMSREGKVIILPTNCVGSELAKLDKYSPKIYKMIKEWWDNKPKLMTGNFTDLKKCVDIEPVAITRFPPKWLSSIKVDKSLSPKGDVLMGYKKGIVTEAEYILEFDKVLKELLPLNVIKNLLHEDGTMLCCYCAKDAFCHRHLVVEWLEEQLDIIIAEYGKEDYYACKGKLKRKWS